MFILRPDDQNCVCFLYVVIQVEVTGLGDYDSVTDWTLCKYLP